MKTTIRVLSILLFGLRVTSLRVFDLLGREVATLVNEVKASGVYTAQWNVNTIASGMYYYRLQAGGFVQTKRLMVMK
jgi:glucuronoarabinoxylan endo-1,4-beta-xylanase